MAMTKAESKAAPRGRGELSLLAILTVLLRNRRLLVVLPAVAVVVGVTLYLIRPPMYTAESRFMPQGKQVQASQLAGLAAQFGFNIGGSVGGESPDFYVELLQSKDLLREVALTEYSFAADPLGRDSLRGNLITLYEIEGDTEKQRVRRAIGRLEEDVAASTDVQAGLVTLQTTAPWPELAVQLNRRLLTLVNHFNLERRQSQAKSERQFVEERMAEARRELERAEEEYAEFLEQNRRFQNSPQLNFEAARLRQQMNLQMDVYSTLAQAYEQARIEEVRNTPVITTVDRPEGSARKAPGNLLLTALLSMIVGGVAAVTIAFGREALERLRQERPEEYAEFDALRGDVVAELKAGGLRWWRRSQGQDGEMTSGPGAADKGSASNDRVMHQG